MTKKIFLITVTGILTLNLFAQGDTIWTLDRCISQAIRYNLEMQRQELMLESTSKDVFQSKMALLPNLNGMIEHQLGSGRVLDRADYTWSNRNVSQGDLGVQSDLTLFNGFQGINNMKMNKASFMMNKENLAAMEKNITISVMTGYLDLLRNHELVEVAKKKAEVTRQQVERMQKLVEVGNRSRGSLLTVNAQLSAEKLALTQAINAREIARLNLMHILNLSDPESFEIVQPEMPEPAAVVIPELNSVFSLAVADLPQIKSAEFGIETQERYLALARGQRSPRIYARGIYYSNYSDGLVNPLDPDWSNPTLDYPIVDQVGNNLYRQFSMGVQIPFFNRWQTQTGISKAKIDLQDARYQYDMTVLALQQSIQQYHTEALAAMDNYIAAKEAVANSDEAHRFAEERFRVGTGTALELQEARNQLYESASAMITSKYVLIFYTEILEFYMGRDIEL